MITPNYGPTKPRNLPAPTNLSGSYAPASALPRNLSGEQYLASTSEDNEGVRPHGEFQVNRQHFSASRPPDLLGRLVDITLALALVLFLAPVILLVALAVMIVDPGPAIFAHRRIGQYGKPFMCLKFRSMYVGAEERLAAILESDPVLRREWEENQKLAEDPRVTPIGEFLRVTSLDELPQLWNVLRGEMSIVGPRPIIAAELTRYGRFADSYFSVKPGLTGLWQVSGRSDTSYRRRVAIDVVYARSKNPWLDLKIIAATVPAVLTRQGSV